MMPDVQSYFEITISKDRLTAQLFRTSQSFVNNFQLTESDFTKKCTTTDKKQ